MTSRTVRPYKILTTEVHKSILESGGIYAPILLQQRLLTSQENLLQALQGENLGLASNPVLGCKISIHLFIKLIVFGYMI